MVEVRNLRKRFGPVTAVDDVSFAAADGQITGLLGENGAGKTTTLALIGGVLKPDDGSVRLDGADARTSHYGRRQLGALLDHKTLYSRLTARENIRYFGELQGLPAADLDERVSSTLTLARVGRSRGPPRRGIFAGRADEGGARPGGRARTAQSPPRRADQRSRHPRGARATRLAQGHAGSRDLYPVLQPRAGGRPGALRSDRHHLERPRRRGRRG